VADEDWLALLQSGDVDTFNGRRTERTRIEIFAEDLSGLKLVGVDLSAATLEKSDFTGTDLTDANLVKANLSGIDGSEIVLRDAMAMRSRFQDAWMDRADLTEADFTEADLADANLERSTATGARFVKARLRGVKAAGANWAGCDLTGAKLHGAALTGIDLRNAELAEATFGEVDLTNARLDAARGAGAKFGQAKLGGARLVGAVLPNANFVQADLTGADLSAADLSRANFTGANLTNAVLRGAVLADANLDGAVLTGADLAEADLSGLDPASLGLGEAAIARLSGFGVAFDADAELVFQDVSVARVGDVVAVVWPNPEGEPPPPPPEVEGEEPAPPEEPRTWRFAVFGPKGSKVVGVLPVPGNTVLDGQVVAFAGAFRVVLTRSRPEGPVLVVAPLGLDGVLGGAKSAPLGYEPAVRPVVRVMGERLRMVGLARQGPTVVVHDLTAEPAPVRSDRLPTARGFLEHPVLACKGEVVVPIGRLGPEAPRRTPAGFPGTVAAALPLGDDLLAVWAVDKQGRTPGGVRWSRIGKRHAPTEEVLDTRTRVIALAVPPVAGPLDAEAQVHAFWLVADEKAGRISLLRAMLPDGEPESLATSDDAMELAGGVDCLAVVGGAGGLAVLALDGRVLASV
jgi:uncharacterized protein YjbI with pentapeptide repeats